MLLLERDEDNELVLDATDLPIWPKVALLPRIIFHEENFEPDYWLIYTSFIGFLIGCCQKISALNRSKSAPNSSDILITVSSLMLCPIQLKSLVILPLLVFSQ